MEYLKNNSSFSAEFLAEVEAYITNVEAQYTQALAWETEVNTAVTTAYESVKDIAELKAKEFVYTPESSTGNNNQGATSESTATANKYASDENQIAVVTYSNGTIFVLNFNNYAVSTVVNGETYTIGAYGYVILKK